MYEIKANTQVQKNTEDLHLIAYATLLGLAKTHQRIDLQRDWFTWNKNVLFRISEGNKISLCKHMMNIAL